MSDSNPKSRLRTRNLMKQKTEVTFEQRDTVVLKQSSSHMTADCPLCKTTVELLTPEILAALTGSTEREIFRLLETRMIHFVETRRIYACPDCYQRVIIESKLSETASGPGGELQMRAKGEK